MKYFQEAHKEGNISYDYFCFGQIFLSEKIGPIFVLHGQTYQKKWSRKLITLSKRFGPSVYIFLIFYLVSLYNSILN